MAVWKIGIETILDTLRSGWRQRKAKRKSAWNVASMLVGFGLLPFIWYGLFQIAWNVHIYFYPGHNGLKNEFWSDGISLSAFIPSVMLTLPLGLPALIVSFFCANFIMWFIPPARRAMDAEAVEDYEMTFIGAQAGLIKIGGIVSAICIILSLIGAILLKSLK